MKSGHPFRNHPFFPTIEKNPFNDTIPFDYSAKLCIFIRLVPDRCGKDRFSHRRGLCPWGGRNRIVTPPLTGYNEIIND